MAELVIMPRQGQSVETCYIVSWKKAIGEQVKQGDILCEVETDKATFEIESPHSGTLLDIFFPANTDVPVLTPICAIGQPGEDISQLRPSLDPASKRVDSEPTLPTSTPTVTETHLAGTETTASSKMSPRAKQFAERYGLMGHPIQGSGPGGRILSEDVEQLYQSGLRFTLAAGREKKVGYEIQGLEGSGIGGRITTEDLKKWSEEKPLPSVSSSKPSAPISESVDASIGAKRIELRGPRKIIAQRMLQSIQTTAQLTLCRTALADRVLDLRRKFKNSDPHLNLQSVTVNDILLFSVARTLPSFPELNAHFDGKTIIQYQDVHLAFAVDTDRGLLVPVIRNANCLSLKEISSQAKQLTELARSGKISPDHLQGGTFTVTNLGALDIEQFTPVLNLPQVAILGIGSAVLRPVEEDGEIHYHRFFQLSLTIDHQVVDGAPAARFLQQLASTLADIEIHLFT